MYPRCSYDHPVSRVPKCTAESANFSSHLNRLFAADRIPETGSVGFDNIVRDLHFPGQHTFERLPETLFGRPDCGDWRPTFVTMTVVPLACTSSRIARHFALKSVALMTRPAM